MTSRRNNPNNYGSASLAERYANSDGGVGFESRDLLAAYNDPSVETKTGDPATENGYNLPGTFQKWKENYSQAEPDTDQRAMRFAQDAAASSVNTYQGLDKALRHEVWKDNALNAGHGNMTAAEREKLVERLSDNKKVDSDSAAATDQLKQANPEHWKRDAARAMVEHRDTLEAAHHLAYISTRDGDEKGLDHARDALDGVEKSFTLEWKNGLKEYGVQPTPTALAYTADTGQEAEKRVAYMERIADRLGLQGDDRRVANAHTAEVIIERDLDYLKQANNEQLAKGGDHQYSGMLHSINDKLDTWAAPSLQNAKSALAHERNGEAAHAYHQLQDTARDVANMDYLFKHPDSGPTTYLTRQVEKESSSFKKYVANGGAGFILDQVEHRLEQAPGGGIKDALKEHGLEEVKAVSAHLAEYEKHSNTNMMYANRHWAAAVESYEKAVMLKHLAEGDQMERYRDTRLTEERAAKEAASYATANTGTMDSATIMYAKESGQTPQCADTLAARHDKWTEPRTQWETTWEKLTSSLGAAERTDHVRAMGFATDAMATVQQNTENLTHLVKEEQNQASWPATKPGAGGLKSALKNMLGMNAQGGAGDPTASFKERYPDSYRQEADALQDISDDLLTANRVLAYEAITRGDAAALENVREAGRQIAYSHNDAITDSPDYTAYHHFNGRAASWQEDPAAAAQHNVARQEALAHALRDENQTWMSASDVDVVETCLADQAASRDLDKARQLGAQLLSYTPEGRHSAAASDLMDHAIEASWMGPEGRAGTIAKHLEYRRENLLADRYNDLHETTYGIAAVCQELEDQNSSLHNVAYRISGVQAAKLAEYNAKGDQASAESTVEDLRNMIHNSGRSTEGQIALYQESLRHLEEVDRHNGMHHAGLATATGEPSHRASAQYHMQVAGMLHYFADADVYDQCINNSALRMMGGSNTP